MTANILLWSYYIANTEDGTDLTAAGPIGTPNTVVVENAELSQAVVCISLVGESDAGGGFEVPPESGDAANCWALRPGQRTPVLTIPSGYYLIANVQTGDHATVQIYQAS